ncbi:MAG: DUF2911 domain-containing protein [Lutibacter sp.]
MDKKITIMNTLKITLVFLLIATVTFAQESPRKQATGKVGAVTVEVDYGAPSVKGRTIWGELVPFEKVWRAGANENTNISFDTDVVIGETTVPAAKYGFFIIPNDNADWVIILSSKNDAWGAFSYSEGEDVLRLNVTPEFVDENQEQLEYAVVDEGIQFAWEKVRLLIPTE